MKRVILFLQILVFISGLAAGASPVVRTISGSPLTVNIGDDASFEIFNSSFPGSGQIFPPSCPSDTADMGVFIRTGSNLIAPDFAEHPCGSASGGIGSSQPWNNRTISGVTGTGTSSDPFVVTVMADATPASDIVMEMRVTYVNGDGFFYISLGFTSANAVSYDAFLGADLYLAGSDSGVPFRIPASGSVGGQTCSGSPYTILLVPLTAATNYTATGYGEVWSQIGAGTLNNSVDTFCEDDGAALEWSGRSISAGVTDSILTAASFGDIPPIAQCSAPGAPGSPEITVTADSSLPVTATDYLTYNWTAPTTGTTPDGYKYSINSDTPQMTTTPPVDFQGPLGIRSDTPVTLNVFAFACSPEQDGPPAQSPPYSLAAPVASFSASAMTVPAGQSMTFTDTSSPQATAWLWFFGDTVECTCNNPSHTYDSPGAYTVFLVATNGSGSSVSAPLTIIVTPPGPGPAAGRRRRARPQLPGKDPDPAQPGDGEAAAAPVSPARAWTLGRLLLDQRNRYWLTLSAAMDTIAYIRIEKDGALLAERRIEILAGPASTVDLGAYPGWDHRLAVDVRVVAERPVAATLEVEEGEGR